ncbi:unnamed protein product [Closterium sp. NIES-64]|nr:unnamed protein product [Closterium sp. NIES-64]
MVGHTVFYNAGRASSCGGEKPLCRLGPPPAPGGAALPGQLLSQVRSAVLVLFLGVLFSASSSPPPPVMPAELAAVVERSLCAVLARHQHLEELLSQPDTSADDLARAGKEMSDLAPAVAIALELQKKTKELQDLHALLKGQGQPYNEDNDTKGGKREGGREADEEDEELRAMVWEEIGVVGGEREALLRSAVRRILPRDEADQRGCIVEVRAGE